MNAMTEQFLIDPKAFDGPVLVTGAGGCIGAWTLGILAGSGVEAVAFDLAEDRRRPALVMGESAARGLIWETGDITDYAGFEQILKTNGITAIIHLAGLQLPFCKANPPLGARVNVEGTINVLEAARTLGLKRLTYASSTAVHGIPPGGPVITSLYGAYKVANENTAQVYWHDWQVPSVGIRPNVVYGVGRDQGMTSKTTVALAHAVQGAAFEIPYTGPVSWLHAGEAASAFIAAVSRDGDGAPVFDLNGGTETVEGALALLSDLAPGHQVTCSGPVLPVPYDLDDGPLRAYLGDYPSVSPKAGITQTFNAFQALNSAGRLARTG